MLSVIPDPDRESSVFRFCLCKEGQGEVEVFVPAPSHDAFLFRSYRLAYDTKCTIIDTKLFSADLLTLM